MITCFCRIGGQPLLFKGALRDFKGALKISFQGDVATKTVLGSRPGCSLLVHSSVCRQVPPFLSLRSNIRISGWVWINKVFGQNIIPPSLFSHHKFCSPFVSSQVCLPASEQCDHCHHWLLPRLLPRVFQVCLFNLDLGFVLS